LPATALHDERQHFKYRVSKVSKTWIYIAHNILKTSKALVTLVKTEQDCLKKLLKTARTTRRISELIRQPVPDRRTGNRKRPMAICVETTGRYNELVTVCRT